MIKVCPVCKAQYERGEVFCPVDATRLATPSQVDDAQRATPDDPLVGTVLADRYRVVRRVGEGGMGIVYEALHVAIEKRVAIKVLRDDYSRRPEVVERFRQEARSASRIGHAHIVDISDFGQTPSGQHFFVMEFLEGEDLASVLAREGTLPARRAVRIALQCARALGAAHQKGIVHRDMKPENIFLVHRDDEADFVKIVDFGIAKMSDLETEGAPGRKLTKTGMIFGTPEYMSPEQAAGKPLDHRVDVYALGVILFEMIAGRVPFVGDSFMGILTQHMFETPPTLRQINPNVDCPPELEAVIYRALAKNPDERFATMEDLARALSAAMDGTGFVRVEGTLHGHGDPGRPPVRGPRLVVPEEVGVGELPQARRPGRGRTGRFAVAGVAAVAAGAIVTWWLVGRGDGSAAATRFDDVVARGDDPAQPRPGAGDEPAPVSDRPGADAVTTGARVDADVVNVVLDAGTARPSPPPSVTVSVTTTPSGARIEVDGVGTVCVTTPCSFETPAGQSIRLRARKGRLSAVRDLEPVQAMAVELVLARRGRDDRDSPEATGSDESASMTRMSGEGPSIHDLKVPDLFR